MGSSREWKGGGPTTRAHARTYQLHSHQTFTPLPTPKQSDLPLPRLPRGARRPPPRRRPRAQPHAPDGVGGGHAHPLQPRAAHQQLPRALFQPVREEKTAAAFGGELLVVGRGAVEDGTLGWRGEEAGALLLGQDCRFLTGEILLVPGSLALGAAPLGCLCSELNNYGVKSAFRAPGVLKNSTAGRQMRRRRQQCQQLAGSSTKP